MRTCRIALLSTLTCLLLLAPAAGFDGTRTPPHAKPPVTPVEAFRSGASALKAGENDKAVSSLQYAAEKGHALAQWKLGRMYAAGDGVPRNELRRLCSSTALFCTSYFPRLAA